MSPRRAILCGWPCFLTTARRLVASMVALALSGVVHVAEAKELIERLPGAVDEHTLLMLDGSRVLAVWERDDGPRHETIWSSVRDEWGRWQVPEIVEFAQGHANGPQLASDGMHGALVVWVQQELRVSGLWSNRFRAHEGWQEPLRVEPVGGELYAPALALDLRGRGFAVWERRDGERMRVRAARYTPDMGWETPVYVDDGAGQTASPRVAVHRDGAAVAAWAQRNGDQPRNIVAAHYRPGAGWSPPRVIDSGAEDAYDVQLAMDGAGNAMAVWEQEIHGEETLFASRLDASGRWSAPVRLELDDEEAYTPRLAIAANGDAMVLWIRARGETGVIAAARFTPRTGWERPSVVQGGELLYVFDADVAMNTRGEAMAVWCKTDGSRNNVWHARFKPESGWDPPALAERRAGSAHRPRVAAAADGSFGLIWKMVESPLPEQALYTLWFLRVP